MSSVSLIDVVSAYYASVGETGARSLGDKPFKEVLPLLYEVQKYHPDLVALSATMRETRGGVCHMDCHVTYMLKEEKGPCHE